MPPSAAADTAARRLTPLRVGTVVWLASELMFFSGLFAAYYTLRSLNDVWPPAGVHLETLRTGAFTVVLVASSVTYHRAARAAESDDHLGARRWTVATAVLAVLFLGNQAAEYAEAGFGITTHAYGSMFFIMTGFHGLHVLGGIVLMFVVLAVAAPGGRAPAGELVVVSEYYWHFVDAVWVAMFATIYLVR